MYPFDKKRYKIIGGPGCGKTTKVIDILAEHFKKGLQPSEILMVGFANATVTTLQERTQAKFELTDNQIKSIITLHKYGKNMACKEFDVFNSKAKREFVKKLKTDSDNWVLLDTEKDKIDQEGAAWDERTDKKFATIFNLINRARHDMNKTLEQILKFYSNTDDFTFLKVRRSEIKYCFNNLNLLPT